MMRTRTFGPLPTRARKVSPSTTRTTEAENAPAGICGDSTGPGSITGGAETPSRDPHATRIVKTSASTARTAKARRIPRLCRDEPTTERGDSTLWTAGQVNGALVTRPLPPPCHPGPARHCYDLQGDLRLRDGSLRGVNLRVRLRTGGQCAQRPRPGPGEEAERPGRGRHHLGSELAGGVEQPHISATLRLAVTRDGPLDDGFRGHVDPLQ